MWCLMIDGLLNRLNEEADFYSQAYGDGHDVVAVIVRKMGDRVCKRISRALRIVDACLIISNKNGTCFVLNSNTLTQNDTNCHEWATFGRAAQVCQVGEITFCMLTKMRKVSLDIVPCTRFWVYQMVVRHVLNYEDLVWRTTAKGHS